ncbi:MAG: hypothetical protein FWF29_05565, partial [Treponema sp.]|nr:hypothetical protein [Treponema sp.]
MIPFIRKYILGGANKNTFAPYIFIILCVYAVFVSVYTALSFSSSVAIVRIIISISVIAVYIILERSPLGRGVLACLAPMAIISLLSFGAVYFSGDFLLFTYTIGAAMISLTYMSSKGLAGYIILTAVGQVFIMVIFGVNLLGASFTMVYNYLSFIVSIAICYLVYIFCKL